jgi:hypothetical protein
MFASCVRYQPVQVFGEDFSNVACAHGVKRFSMNSAKVGTGFLSTMPASPFASLVRWAASICRAIRGLPWLVLR